MGVQGREGLGGYRGNISLDAMKEVAAEEQQEVKAEQLSSLKAFQENMEEAVNPFAAKFAVKQKPITSRTSKVQKAKETSSEARLLPIEAIKEAASRFQRNTNGELTNKMLMLLREYVKAEDSPKDILRKLQEVFAGKDPAVLDEALDFLLETTDGPLKENVRLAQDELRSLFKREIAAGRNIAAQAREEGVGTPTAMRDLYLDITGNPKDVNTLFDELSNKYPYAELKKVVKFLLSSLGADLRAKGPSIPRRMLHRLLTETRTLQAILGVYSFFRGRMPLLSKMFQKQRLPQPPSLTFEALSKQFMSLVNDRYPSEEKVLQSAQRLGVDRWLRAKIIVLSQLRDAIREVAKERIYRSLQDRDKLYDAIIIALENLEDELQELEALEEEGLATSPNLVVIASATEARVGDHITFTARISGGTAPYTIYWQWADEKGWKIAESPCTRIVPPTPMGLIPMMVLVRDNKEMGSKTAIIRIKIVP